jgi:hypothetical protein
VVIKVAAARLSIVGTRFEQEVALGVRYADVLLDGAAFAKRASIAFAEAPFLPPPSPEQPPPPPLIHSIGLTLDEIPLKQTGLPPQPRLLSLRRVDATNLVLADLDLAWCLFRGAHNLDKLRIEGPKHFATSPKIWWWTERRTLAEEQQWRQIRHRNQDWTPPSDQALSWVAERSGQPVQQADPDHVAPLYRALRKAEEDAKYEPGAADFYYGEMEMRRHAHGTPWIEKWLLWVYWLVSGYSLRASRALACLAILTAALAVAFHLIGFTHPPQPDSYWTSLLYAFRATLSLTDDEVKLTAWGKLLQALLRITGPVLLGLALLAVRGRVKR